MQYTSQAVIINRGVNENPECSDVFTIAFMVAGICRKSRVKGLKELTHVIKVFVSQPIRVDKSISTLLSKHFVFQNHCFKQSNHFTPWCKSFVVAPFTTMSTFHRTPRCLSRPMNGSVVFSVSHGVLSQWQPWVHRFVNDTCRQETPAEVRRFQRFNSAFVEDKDLRVDLLGSWRTSQCLNRTERESQEMAGERRTETFQHQQELWRCGWPSSTLSFQHKSRTCQKNQSASSAGECFFIRSEPFFLSMTPTPFWLLGKRRRMYVAVHRRGERGSLVFGRNTWKTRRPLLDTGQDTEETRFSPRKTPSWTTHSSRKRTKCRRFWWDHCKDRGKAIK